MSSIAVVSVIAGLLATNLLMTNAKVEPPTASVASIPTATPFVAGSLVKIQLRSDAQVGLNGSPGKMTGFDGVLIAVSEQWVTVRASQIDQNKPLIHIPLQSIAMIYASEQAPTTQPR